MYFMWPLNQRFVYTLFAFSHLPFDDIFSILFFAVVSNSILFTPYFFTILCVHYVIVIGNGDRTKMSVCLFAVSCGYANL